MAPGSRDSAPAATPDDEADQTETAEHQRVRLGLRNRGNLERRVRVGLELEVGPRYTVDRAAIGGHVAIRDAVAAEQGRRIDLKERRHLRRVEEGQRQAGGV